ncbi:MAG: ABC transporter ATP-binding protein, partial [Clostridiales bacterium]|nr:ABC transporter ATP-binding protein [Clostridiales bacterium]
MLKLNDIYKTFNQNTVNEKRVINGLSLHLRKGDFVTV